MGQRWVKIILAVLLVLAAIIVFYHQYDSDRQDHESKHVPDLTKHDLVLVFTTNLLLATFLLLAYVINVVFRNYNISTPTSAFIVIIGFLWGIFAAHDPVVRLASSFMLMSPEEILFIYYPIMLFNIAFCLDVPIFLKTLPQSVVIGFPVFAATGLTYGIMAKEIVNRGWSNVEALSFGIISSLIYPKTITLLLKQHSIQTKQIAVLLEAEALFTFITADLMRELALNRIEGILAHWYQFVAVLTRFVVFGILTGVLFGYLGQCLLRKTYTQKYSAMLLCFALPFAVHALSDKFLGGLGSIPVAIMGVMMGRERTILPKEIEFFLIDFWEVLGFVFDIIICLKSAMIAGTYIVNHLTMSDYSLVVAAYFVYFVVRFLCFLIFSCVISRLGYGMDLRGMFVCAWGGLKSPFSLEIVASLRNLDTEIYEEFFFYVLGVYFLSHLINGSFTNTLLEALDLTRISRARQMNMNNCMKQLFAKREKTVHILKQDRFLADANWPTVIEATNVMHPYRTQVDVTEDEEFFLGYRFTYCSDCKKDVHLEPRPKEFKEMTREAKIRVLKAKKMSYSRHYENGMISKEAIRILNQAVELAADSHDAEIKVEDLYRRFTEENCFQRFIRKRTDALKNKKTRVRPPRTYWRRVCYHFVVPGRTFAKIMLLIVFLNLILIGIDFYYHSSVFTKHEPIELGDAGEYCILTGKIIFTLIYLIEFIIKIMGFSYIRVCAHGFRTYFKSLWNIVDFIVLVGCFPDLYWAVKNLNEGKQRNLEDYLKNKFHQTVDVLQLLRVFRLLRLPDTFYSDIISYLDSVVESRLAFTYELGKSYATTEAEIFDMLPYMIDNKRIREEIGKKIETDRAYITKLLGLVQKERPWIAITVKTKQAIRTIHNGMREAINSLKTSGWIDSYEYVTLVSSMEDLYKKVNSIQKVQPSPPKVIFKEVAWMAEDEPVIDFLFENVTVKSFEPGQVVFTEGNVADGVYIVVTGLFMITYTPDPNILAALEEYGRLPVVDYLSGTKYEEASVDYIVSGNCIGELSTLTGRSYNCTITADSQSQVYVLSCGVLKRAMELSPDPAIGLECRLWKEVSVRIAIPLLLSTPAYHAFSQDQIKFALERAFVPDLSKFKIFTVTDVIEDIILIEGVVSDFNTREMYFAPCYIPRTVQKLILPTSSLMEIPIHTETRLLIIPAKDVDEIDVMMMAEETGEMVYTASAIKCLQHAIQEQIRRKRRRRRQNLMGTSSSRGRRLGHLAKSIGESLSRYTTGTKSISVSYKNEKSEMESVYTPADEYTTSSSQVLREVPILPPRKRRVSMFVY